MSSGPIQQVYFPKKHRVFILDHQLSSDAFLQTNLIKNRAPNNFYGDKHTAYYFVGVPERDFIEKPYLNVTIIPALASRVFRNNMTELTNYHHLIQKLHLFNKTLPVGSLNPVDGKDREKEGESPDKKVTGSRRGHSLGRARSRSRSSSSSKNNEDDASDTLPSVLYASCSPEHKNLYEVAYTCCTTGASDRIFFALFRLQNDNLDKIFTDLKGQTITSPIVRLFDRNYSSLPEDDAKASRTGAEGAMNSGVLVTAGATTATTDLKEIIRLGIFQTHALISAGYLYKQVKYCPSWAVQLNTPWMRFLLSATDVKTAHYFPPPHEEAYDSQIVLVENPDNLQLERIREESLFAPLRNDFHYSVRSYTIAMTESEDFRQLITELSFRYICTFLFKHFGLDFSELPPEKILEAVKYVV